MAEYHMIWNETFQVQSATSQYTIARFVSANIANIASEDVHSSMLGVFQTKANPGEFASVGFQWVSKVLAGGSVTAGVFLTTDGSGRATAATSGDMTFGRALT